MPEFTAPLAASRTFDQSLVPKKRVGICKENCGEILAKGVCCFFSKGESQKNVDFWVWGPNTKKLLRFSKRLWHLFLLILRLKKSKFLWINIFWAILLRQGHGQEKHGNIPNSESHLGVVTGRRERWNACVCRVDWSQRLRNHKRCKAEKFNPIGKILDI